MSLLSAEDLAMFGQAPIESAEDDPFADLIPEQRDNGVPESLAAVIPPDAPAADANTPAPEKKKRKPKTIIIDESTVPDAELIERAAKAASAALIQGKEYSLPSGQTGTFNCVTNSDALSFNVAPGKVELVPGKVELVPAGFFPVKAMADVGVPPEKTSLLVLEPGQALTIEFGPNTLDFLRRMFGK